MAITHTIRARDGGTKAVRLTYKSTVRAFCYECCGFLRNEVDLCTAKLCPLWPFRNSKTVKASPSQDGANIRKKRGFGVKAASEPRTQADLPMEAP